MSTLVLTPEVVFQTFWILDFLKFFESGSSPAKILRLRKQLGWDKLSNLTGTDLDLKDGQTNDPSSDRQQQQRQQQQQNQQRRQQQQLFLDKNEGHPSGKVL